MKPIPLTLSSLAILLATVTTYAQDPLPSWNDTAAKKAIVTFVEKVTKEGSPDFVPPNERIATFDNDGTLWCEKPLSVQILFALDRVKALAPQHPEWKRKSLSRPLLKGDMKGAWPAANTALLEIVEATHAGMTTDEFEKDRQGLDRDRETSQVPASSTPRWSISRCSSCSRICARTASRPSSSPAAASSSCAHWRRKPTAFRPSRSSAAAARLKLEMRDGKPVLVKLPEINFIDDKDGKPVGINQHIGRRPIAAFGNSDGDLQMLECTGAGSGARFCLYVHHDDAEREYAYDRKDAWPGSTRGSTKPQPRAGPSSA